MESALFGGGCFWCTEAVFQNLKGVHKVTSGYASGTQSNPTYIHVSAGTTGHAEVVKVEFDPPVITFKQLVEVFFLTHNPTTLNKQGADVGTQYRSIIIYTNNEQKVQAEAVKNDIEKEKIYDSPIVTEIVPFTMFYEAEDYHKDYYVRNSDAPYCQVIIDPKLAKLRSRFAQLLKEP